jgi:sugar (pentulose or hexulose) kinase
MKTGFLGIDVGTQGLSVVLVDDAMKVIADGNGYYDMVPGLEKNCYEQDPLHWEAALRQAMDDLRSKLEILNVRLNAVDQKGTTSPADPLDERIIDVSGIGIAGQMHGEVLADKDSNLLGPARLWCDGRNEMECVELTSRLNFKCPKRLTACRWLYTVRNKPVEYVKRVAHITTPAGWLAHKLTGDWILGVGDASGIFPIDQCTGDYEVERLAQYDALIKESFLRRTDCDVLPAFSTYLPKARKAGEYVGTLTPAAASLLGLREGILVAPAEGDQPAALAGSLIGCAGQVSMCFGTSVVCNSVCDRQFVGISKGVDHFCAADGKPINMVWLRNGTTPMNMIISMFGHVLSTTTRNVFSALMPLILDAPDDCEGLMASPFMDDEPNMGVQTGGSCGLIGLNRTNSKPGNVAKAMLLATFFNLRIGCGIVAEQGFQRTEIILSGGITKTANLGQLVADVFDTPVAIMEAAQEGCAWGAAVLAKYASYVQTVSRETDWAQFLVSLSASAGTDGTSIARFHPRPRSVETLNISFQKHLKLIELQDQLASIING